ASSAAIPIFCPSWSRSSYAASCACRPRCAASRPPRPTPREPPTSPTAASCRSSPLDAPPDGAYTGAFFAGGSMDIRVATEHEGALIRLTLCAPPARRLDSAAVRELAGALSVVTDRAKLIVFCGDGNDFALGGDASAA